jgi:hypothetical protein
MTGEEIRDKINFNNQKIQSLMDPSVFILQPEVQKYMEDNEYLKSICPHKYENNTCIYCGHIINP